MIIAPTLEDIAFMDDLKASMRPVIDRHPTLDAWHMLSVTSQLVGNLIALQDQTKVSPEIALECVSRNIEIGNAEVIQGLLKVAPASRA